MVELQHPTKNRQPVGRLGNGSPFFFYDDDPNLSKPCPVRRYLDPFLPVRCRVFPSVHTDTVSASDNPAVAHRTNSDHSSNQASCDYSIHAATNDPSHCKSTGLL